MAVVFAAWVVCSTAGQTQPVPASSTKAVLAYADDFSLVTISGPAGEKIAAMEGAEIPAGGTIRTGATSAELSLVPNGSLMRLAQGSVFTVERLERGEEKLNAFALITGKIRTVAANVLGTSYRIRVQQAVFGVRGTDFIVQTGVLDSPDALVVLEGVVEAFDVEGYRRSLIEAGKLLTFGSPEWEAAPIPTELLSSIMQSDVFKRLDPATVPRIPGYRNDYPYEKDLPPKGEAVPRSSTAPKTASDAAKKEPTAEGTATGETTTGGAAAASAHRGPDDRRTETARQSNGFVLSIDGTYGRLLSADTSELGTSNFGGALGAAFGHNGPLSFRTGLAAGAYLLDDGGEGIERIIAAPLTGFIATDVPLGETFLFGVRMDGGVQLVMIEYAADTDFPDETGFVPYIAARASFGVAVGLGRTDTFVSVGIIAGDLVMPLAQAGVSLSIGF